MTRRQRQVRAFARQHGIAVRLAARMLRQDERSERRVLRGEITFAQHVREIRQDVDRSARAVRP